MTFQDLCEACDVKKRERGWFCTPCLREWQRAMDVHEEMKKAEQKLRDEGRYSFFTVVGVSLEIRLKWVNKRRVARGLAPLDHNHQRGSNAEGDTETAN